MMTRCLTSILGIFLAGSVAAQGTQYLSTDGTLFAFEENEHGAVLTSIESLEEVLILNEAATTPLDVGDTLYLGRSCDAFSLEFGEGSWSGTNGGFMVEFPGLRMAFPGQAIDIVPGNLCRI